ncbi:hypothetical protein SESBI_19140 [Sesbania bispinosa]|nr:hypothetical protein SESBI_19140 [Sesbania bispinosa]
MAQHMVSCNMVKNVSPNCETWVIIRMWLMAQELNDNYFTSTEMVVDSQVRVMNFV